MKKYNFESKLLRYNDTLKKWEVIDKRVIQEYESDCLNANLFYTSLNAFENEIINNDVIYCNSIYTIIKDNRYIETNIDYNDIILK